MFPKIEEIFTKNRNQEKYVKNHYSDFYVYLMSNYDFCESFQERLYCYFHNISKCPKCHNCGNSVHFNSISKGYRLFCSPRCAALGTIKKSKQTCLERYGDENYRNTEKSKQTCLERYGVEYSTQTDVQKKKSKQTCLERYGNENYNNFEKYKQTCLERYGVENTFAAEKIKDKIKQTCLARYNVKHYSQTNEYKKKSKQTCLERYGDENYRNTEKSKQTCLERYGVEYSTQSDKYKNKLDKIKSKKIQTCLKKYGCKYYSQSNFYKNNLVLFQQKANETKRKNNSFNKSSIEEQFAVWLNENNINYIRQYKSEQYPFCCDFYFPDIDLYFEINGFWTHGLHPFDANNESDIKKLESWKQMNTDFYNNAIKTWTVSDPLKVKTAKDNGLNFKVIYSDRLNDVIKEYNL